VEDAAPFWPVPTCTCRAKQLHRPRLLEEESARLQCILLGRGEVPERVVGALQILGQLAEGLFENLFQVF